MFPQYRQTNKQERLGVNAVAEAISRAGLIWRETPVSDVGIDGQIEYVSSEGFATGKIVAVQIKSGKSYFIDCDDNWLFYPDDKHLLYWEGFPLPVLIILHNPETALSYWLDIRQALRAPQTTNGKGVLIPKRNILQEVRPEVLFESYAVLGQELLSCEDVLEHLINARSRNDSFPISYFDLFCLGLTNICRSLYFSMDLAMSIAEIRQNSFDSFLGGKDHDFLFDYIKFLVHQHIADINFSDCLIDWYDRKLQPKFLAPLTSRGRTLVQMIQDMQTNLKNHDLITDYSSLYAAQEGLIAMQIDAYFVKRVSLSHLIQSTRLKKQKN